MPRGGEAVDLLLANQESHLMAACGEDLTDGDAREEVTPGAATGDDDVAFAGGRGGGRGIGRIHLTGRVPDDYHPGECLTRWELSCHP